MLTPSITVDAKEFYEFVALRRQQWDSDYDALASISVSGRYVTLTAITDRYMTTTTMACLEYHGLTDTGLLAKPGINVVGFIPVGLLDKIDLRMLTRASKVVIVIPGLNDHRSPITSRRGQEIVGSFKPVDVYSGDVTINLGGVQLSQRGELALASRIKAMNDITFFIQQLQNARTVVTSYIIPGNNAEILGMTTIAESPASYLDLLSGAAASKVIRLFQGRLLEVRLLRTSKLREYMNDTSFIYSRMTIVRTIDRTPMHIIKL